MILLLVITLLVILLFITILVTLQVITFLVPFLVLLFLVITRLVILLLVLTLHPDFPSHLILLPSSPILRSAALLAIPTLQTQFSRQPLLTSRGPPLCVFAAAMHELAEF